MERTRVTSQLLRSVGYDPVKQILEVEFLKQQNEEERRVYQYHSVPPDRVEQLMTAQSTGSFFLKMIKPNYKCTRIEEKIEKEKSSDETQA